MTVSDLFSQEFWQCPRCGALFPEARVKVVGHEVRADGTRVVVVQEKTCKCRVVEVPQLPSRFQWK